MIYLYLLWPLIPEIPNLSRHKYRREYGKKGYFLLIRETMEIKPGLNISIVLSIDYRRETLDIKRSIIHDVNGDLLIIAQTDPLISRTHLNHEVYLTFLQNDYSQASRYGFPARIIEFLKDFKLSSQQEVQAVVLRRIGDLQPHNLRMFYRLEPPGNCGIDIFINGYKVNILDISIGGASISHAKIHPFKIDEEVKLMLVIDERAHQVNARVIRIWQSDDIRMLNSIGFASLQFLSLDGHLKNTLGCKIRDIERALRCKELDGGSF